MAAIYLNNSGTNSATDTVDLVYRSHDATDSTTTTAGASSYSVNYSDHVSVPALDDAVLEAVDIHSAYFPALLECRDPVPRELTTRWPRRPARCRDPPETYG